MITVTFYADSLCASVCAAVVSRSFTSTVIIVWVTFSCCQVDEGDLACCFVFSHNFYMSLTFPLLNTVMCRTAFQTPSMGSRFVIHFYWTYVSIKSHEIDEFFVATFRIIKNIRSISTSTAMGFNTNTSVFQATFPSAAACNSSIM